MLDHRWNSTTLHCQNDQFANAAISVGVQPDIVNLEDTRTGALDADRQRTDTAQISTDG